MKKNQPARNKKAVLFVVEPTTERSGVPNRRLASSAEKPARGTSGEFAEREATEVEARIDVGMGNTLFIRGQGGGLDWTKGQPLTCVDKSRWVWRTKKADGLIRFKLLLNDQIWAQGEDVVAAPLSRVEIAPRF